MYNNICIYLPTFAYLGYSTHLYTKNKSKKTLYINIGVAIIIQGMILSIYSQYLNKNKPKLNIEILRKSCILSKRGRNKKVRFNPEIKVRFIENRYEKF